MTDLNRKSLIFRKQCMAALKRLLLLVFFLPWATPSGAQNAFQWGIRKIKNYYNDTSQLIRPRLLAYPTVAYSPETSLEVGGSAVLLFHARNDTSNRLSEVQAFAFATVKAQYGLWLENAVYGHQDKWFFLGRARFQRFPLLYYGIGNGPDDIDPAVVDANYIIIRQRALRKVFRRIFTGPEVDYQRLYRTSFEQPEDAPLPHPPGHTGSSNLGLGWGIVYDTRHNVLNVRDGYFAEIAFLEYNKALGSDFDFTSIYMDGRIFRPFGRNVLAAQVYGNFINGDAPFNQLALMGGETMQRGYYLGRYRDKNLVSAQLEYRWLPFSFSRRLGGAAFASAAAVAPEISKFALNNIQPTGGFGLRYLLFQKKDIYVRLDLGFTREGFGFYFFTGEAF